MKYLLFPNIPLPNVVFFPNSIFGKSRFVYSSQIASALLYFKISTPADTLVSLYQNLWPCVDWPKGSRTKNGKFQDLLTIIWRCVDWVGISVPFINKRCDMIISRCPPVLAEGPECPLWHLIYVNVNHQVFWVPEHWMYECWLCLKPLITRHLHLVLLCSWLWTSRIKMCYVIKLFFF